MHVKLVCAHPVQSIELATLQTSRNILRKIPAVKRNVPGFSTPQRSLDFQLFRHLEMDFNDPVRQTLTSGDLEIATSR